jgi:hypothetical protein
MRNTLKLIILILFLNKVVYSQTPDDETKPSGPVKLHHRNISQNTSSVFINQNLSNNALAQNETSVRINRKSPNFVVAAWRDFRLGINPPVRRIGYTYSINGGLTWAPSQLLPDPLPEHTSQSDPVVTSDSSGYFYISSTSRQPPNDANRDMIIYRSTDNGITFSYYSKAVPSTGSVGEDKEWIFCDPVKTNSTYNNIFISWTSFGSSQGIKFRKSTNAGLNWSSTVNVGDNTSGQGSSNCSGTNGEIYVVWASNGIMFDKSTNGGVSFGPDYTLNPSFTTAEGSFPYVCVDYSNKSTRGNVYVVWADTRAGTGDDVWLQRSTNSGMNWLTTPIRVNDVSVNNQYYPFILCDTSGVLHLIYYDERTGAGAVNSYYAYSTDAGSTWNNQKLSDSTFVRNYFNGDIRVGEYIGLDVYAGSIIPVWMDGRRGGTDQEIYTAIVPYPLSVSQNSNLIPENFSLYQNYPNPFNPATTINFDISERTNVRLSIYDQLGREIEVLINEVLQPGSYNYQFSAKNYSSGIYYYKMITDHFTQSRKMIISK